MVQLALFTEQDGRPDGLRYQPEFVSRAVEAELIMRLQALPLQPFRFGAYEGKRRVVSFGFRYDYSTRRVEDAETIPFWLKPIISSVEQFGELPRDTVAQVLVTEYEPGAGIGWHRDKPQFGKIFGLSLNTVCSLRFRRRTVDKWERFTLRAEPRSLYMMSGESRQQWQHSIPGVEERRYSITFRTMREEFSN